MTNQYTRNPPLLEADLLPDPLVQFQHWLNDATQAGVVEPTAMTLATVSVDGQPSARVVLLKGVDEGFCFYTSYESRKGRDLASQPKAALVFWWDRLERSVRVEGAVEKMMAVESERYFHTRPRGSQLASYTSRQSHTVDSRETLEARLSENVRHFSGKEIPLPVHWGGYRLRPATVEFWQGQRDRFHDRLIYRRGMGGWNIQRLEP